tara:strand:- start:22083 stop:23162 length:1080 start_codon:yes stop_codon:yes gene_type:complete
MEVFQLSKNNFTVSSTYGDYIVRFESFSNFKQTIDFDKFFFIVDNDLKTLYNNLLSDLPIERTLIVNSSEESKSFEQSSIFLKELLSKKIKKDNTLVAIGGGVVQDITAFLSSIIFRGIDWIFVPTTLLAQCDSCIGSKTSINFQSYKNVLGNFYPPKKVIIDETFLDSLPESEIKSGIGEMTHYYFFEGSNFLKDIYHNYDNIVSRKKDISPYIIESLNIKKKVIEVDEFDTGIRNHFQFGHTFGHAIENASNYQINHGQAVTIGMDISMFVSYTKKLMNENDFNFYHQLISKNFPILKLSEFDFDSFYDALKKDKKNIENYLVCILIKEPGDLKKSKIEINNDLKNILKSYFKRFWS